MRNKNWSFKKKEGLTLEQKDFKGGYPAKEKVSSGSELVDYMAFRDLSFKGAIEPYADPNTEAAKGSYPYAILNNTNRVIEAKYPGYKNLTGNSVVRLQNSVKSQFLNFFDSIVMKKRLNYLYLAYGSSDKNLPTNVEMVKAFEQALSYGYSTMLTQLPFYTDAVNTDLPRGSSGHPLYGGHNDTYDRMGALLHYQIVMQNIVSPLAKYVELLSLEEELMDMSYRREAPLVQQVFGQLKKKAFIAQLNAVGTVVLGEYFDTNWWKQMNALRHIPSRKANDMNHPIITMVTTTRIPRCKLFPTSDDTLTPYYDSNTALSYTVPANTLVDPETFTTLSSTSFSLEQLVLNLNKLLDAHYLLTWARKKNTGTLPSGAIGSASAYYQAVVQYTNAISTVAGIFGSNMTEIRTFLDKMSDTGMVYWKKGIKFDIGKIYPKSLTYNQIIADVLKATLAGADKVYFDSTTQRWICNTEWDMYSGINKFDNYSGGSFLTFSLRDISLTDTDGNAIGEQSSSRLLPVLFSADEVTQDEATVQTGHTRQGVRSLNRLGTFLYLDSFSITNANLNTDIILSRLNPLSDARLSIKAPNFNSSIFDVTVLSGADRAHLLAALHKSLLQIAKYDRVAYSTVVSSSCDPDLIAVIDLQVEDVSNAMIQFCRNYSPFRVNTLDGERSMGFGTGSNSTDIQRS